MLRRILIANRGEIALRIIRTCREMNIETVAVYSTADADALYVKLATKAVCIGPARAADSYLNVRAILEAALQNDCDAIHPGYGFLSENSDFARLCEQIGLTFIGPGADVMDALGNKIRAKELMIAGGVPVVPGSDGAVTSIEQLKEIADKMGYPVLLKAAAGGGGKGMRRVYRPEDLVSAFEEAKAEARACFSDDEMYLEKLIENPRHIEVQILADRFGNAVHLGERDCSIQRKNQKLIEESPYIFLSDEMRKKMGEAAVSAAKAAGYSSAGTVEFVLAPDGAFYFIEMNTRIQVEHGVTELVTGLDLIREQIYIAAGKKLRMEQKDVVINGHAIECRINAENPAMGFRPAAGNVGFVHFPGGPGVRVDTALYPDAEISPFYDSMIAKILVHAPSRLEAIRKMRRALEELVIEGVSNTGDFCYLVLHHPDFIAGKADVSFLEKNMEELLAWDESGEEESDEP